MSPVQYGAQSGPQKKFLETMADIAMYGGGAGGGKTYGMLLDFIRHVNAKAKHVKGLFLRRTTPELTGQGGAWDNASEMYAGIAGLNESKLTASFGLGTVLKFDHLQHLKDLARYQSQQLDIIYFDELCHFLRKMFFYMLSRNRSAYSTVKPYIRACMNPEADHWVFHDFLKPGGYVGDDGFPIEKMSGVIKYFYYHADQVMFGDTKEELKKRFPAQPEDPLSFTFIPSLVTDNKILMERDKTYVAKLESMPYVMKMRLRYGNWSVKEDAGRYFSKSSFKVVQKEELPKNLYCIRYWDMAGTKPEQGKKVSSSQARTASVLLGLDTDSGNFYILDVTDELLLPKEVEDRVISLGKMDGVYVIVGLSQDPGQAGKFQVEYYVERLEYNSLTTWVARETGSKEARANPVAQKARHGFFHIVESEWNDRFLVQAENFPGDRMDMVDALSGGFAYFVDNNMVSLEAYTEPANISKYAKQNQQEAKERQKRAIPAPEQDFFPSTGGGVSW